MDVSAEQESEMWLNKDMNIPSFPANRRDHYPFSKDPAFGYRRHLAVYVLGFGYLLWQGEGCTRLHVLMLCWLFFVLYETAYRNYPWREPLNIWLWRLYFAVPFSGLLFPLCAALLLLSLLYAVAGCELGDLWLEGPAAFFMFMLYWPVVRERAHRAEAGHRAEDDYDQFSSIRSYSLVLPGPLRILYAALHSPSLLCLATAFAATSLVALFLPGGVADVWTVVTGCLLLGCLAALCCEHLPDDIARTLAAWEAEEADYARKIGNYLLMVKVGLETCGLPIEDTPRFDRLAVHVPLLLREVQILRHTGRVLDERKAQELQSMIASKELVEFRRKLDNYGPYTSRCCIS